MLFEAKFFCVEKVKKKKKPRTIQENFSVCNEVKPEGKRYSLQSRKTSPCYLVSVFYSKKQNNWWERNWEAKVQQSEGPSESSPLDENRKETKEERSSIRKASVPLCSHLQSPSLPGSEACWIVAVKAAQPKPFRDIRWSILLATGFQWDFVKLPFESHCRWHIRS